MYVRGNACRHACAYSMYKELHTLFVSIFVEALIHVSGRERERESEREREREMWVRVCMCVHLYLAIYCT